MSFKIKQNSRITKSRILYKNKDCPRTKLITTWYFIREYINYIKRRIYHYGIDFLLYYEWYQQPFNCNYVRIFSSLGFY